MYCIINNSCLSLQTLNGKEVLIEPLCHLLSLKELKCLQMENRRLTTVFRMKHIVRVQRVN